MEEEEEIEQVDIMFCARVCKFCAICKACLEDIVARIKSDTKDEVIKSVLLHNGPKSGSPLLVSSFTVEVTVAVMVALLSFTSFISFISSDNNESNNQRSNASDGGDVSPHSVINCFRSFVTTTARSASIDGVA